MGVIPDPHPKLAGNPHPTEGQDFQRSGQKARSRPDKKVNSLLPSVQQNVLSSLIQIRPSASGTLGEDVFGKPAKLVRLGLMMF